MVWPSSALISSPSIRIDIFFGGKVLLLSAHGPLDHIDGRDVATQAAAGFIERLFVAQAGYDFIL